MSDFTPTSEQIAAVNAAKDSTANLAIIARAGAAKTSTLVLIGEALPQTDILCLAFNKAIAEEMTERLPPNCESKTLHVHVGASKPRDAGVSDPQMTQDRPGAATDLEEGPCAGEEATERPGDETVTRAEPEVVVLKTRQKLVTTGIESLPGARHLGREGWEPSQALGGQATSSAGEARSLPLGSTAQADQHLQPAERPSCVEGSHCSVQAVRSSP